MNEYIDFKSLGFQTKEMYEFPTIINLEVYRGNCPCSCVHCPIGIIKPEERKLRFGEEEMSLELYKKIIDEISKHPSSTIRIHSTGEPLLWKNLSDAAKYSKEKKVRSWIFTCAITNDDNLLNDLCENVDIIEISVNSIKETDYRETKGVDAFDLVCKNIKKMHDYIKNNNLKTRLIVSRVQSLDKNNDKEFIEFWKKSFLVDDAFIRSYHTYNDVLEKIELEEKNLKHEPCLVHWARFNISVKGFVVICFNELFKKTINPTLTLGDLNKETIEEIWHGKKLTALRKAELTRDYSDLPFKDLPCKNCFSCQPLHGNKETSEHQINELEGEKC